MKKLTLILALAFTMGLGVSTVSAQDKTTKAKTECCAKAEKKACCTKEAKAECPNAKKACTEKKAEEKK